MGALRVGALAIGVSLDLLGSLAVWLAASIAADIDFGAIAPVLILSLGLAQTTYAGFVTGCIAKTNDLVHGLAVGGCGLAIAMVLGVRPIDEVPAWFNPVSHLGALPAGALGGHLAAALRRFDRA